MGLLDTIKSLFGFKSNSHPLSPGDRMLVCEDCHQKFVFDEGEQRFFKAKGFTDPKRCPVCRKKVRSKSRRRHRGFGRRGRDRSFSNRNSVIDGDSPYADER